MTLDPETRKALEESAGVLFAEALQRASVFLATLVPLPDHAAVLVASSKMDELLGSAIKARLLPNTGREDRLLDTDRGIGTFANRIELAYRLGIIGTTVAEALQTIRKTRNIFAHAYEGQSLDVSPHRDRISDLSRGFEGLPRILAVRRELEAITPPQSKHRLHFLIACVNLIAKLECALASLQRIDDRTARSINYP